MADLAKGERFNLTKETGGDRNFYIGLEWTPPQNATKSFDLDAVAFGCEYDGNDDPKLFRDDYFVYYGRAKSQGAPFSSEDKAICHSGDNLTGDDTDDGDDEQIRIYLDKLDPRAKEVSILATIYDGVNKGQNFGQVKKASIRVCQMDSAGNPTTELLKFNLTEDYSAFTAIQFGQLYLRDDGAWAFNATGVGFDSLQSVLSVYNS